MRYARAGANARARAKNREARYYPNREAENREARYYPNREKKNLVWKKAAIDFASIVADEIIRRSSGRRRWI